MKAKLIIAIVMFFMLFGGGLVSGYLVLKREKQSSYAGIIKDIEINEKGYPTIVVGVQKININASHNWKKINIGDFIEKKPNVSEWKIVKAKTGQVIIIKQTHYLYKII